MIQEAINRILELSNGQILTMNRRNYSKYDLKELPSPSAERIPIHLHTLDGLIEMYKNEVCEDSGIPKAFYIYTPRHVCVQTYAYGNWKQRDEYAIAQPFEIEKFPFNKYLDIESFITHGQTKFSPNKELEQVLKYVGNIQAEKIDTSTDDGITQTATVRKGITQRAAIKVPNPIKLKPYYTFPEIEQPTLSYLLRMRREKDEGLPEIALFEVADNSWKLETIIRIRSYLETSLPNNTQIYA